MSKKRDISTLRGVGPKIKTHFTAMGLHTVQDVWFHLPHAYQDRTRVCPISDVCVGMHAVVEGEVEASKITYSPKRTLVCRISDGTGGITLRFFHFNRDQQRALSEGVFVRCFGQVVSHKDALWMVHPHYQCIDRHMPPPLEQYLTPIYPIVGGLQQARLRNIIQESLVELDAVEDLLPEALRAQWDLPSLSQALLGIHRPSPPRAKTACRDRLALEELLAHQLGMLRGKQRAQQDTAVALSSSGEKLQAFISGLPFALTCAQQRVCEEITSDCAQEKPMLRLVQGDVGCGKTIVAMYAALLAVESGHQVAVMAPTEVLAQQHMQSFIRWLAPLGVRVVYLSGQVMGVARREVLQHIADGTAQIVVGTHALFQEQVQFADLALVIVDEQHRFGVHQRLALREKGRHEGYHPHQLVLTATPIPRTLMMTCYADLDVSIIAEMPPGRKPVTTALVSQQRRQEVVERIASLCARGQQVYWVCPTIETSEVLQCQAAEESATHLCAQLPDLRIGLVHGRMPSEDRAQVMQRFVSGDYDVLVATTVIEVGVDVPAASLMVIENPERFGLSQLHQLRGRVGRGAVDSYCVLLYGEPLSGDARERLQIMRQYQDGFRIAEKDLELRGPGEILGVRQSGVAALRIADILQDQHLLKLARHAAEVILAQYPHCVQPLLDRWIVHRAEYGVV